MMSCNYYSEILVSNFQVVLIYYYAALLGALTLILAVVKTLIRVFIFTQACTDSILYSIRMHYFP